MDYRSSFSSVALASRSSSFFFRHKPPPYPVSDPSEPITRWQGIRIAIRLSPFARATARTASGGRSSTPGARSYVVVPTGMRSSSFHTFIWNGVPGA